MEIADFTTAVQSTIVASTYSINLRRNRGFLPEDIIREFCIKIGSAELDKLIVTQKT